MTAIEPAVTRWADRIRPHLAQAVEGIVAAGVDLVHAKNSLGHGPFGGLCEQLGLTRRTAQRFMAIAKNDALRDATHASHLPPSWTTLFELSRAPAAELGQAIETGEVTPRLDRKMAKQLVVRITPPKPGGPLGPPPLPTPEQIEERRLAWEHQAGVKDGELTPHGEAMLVGDVLTELDELLEGISEWLPLMSQPQVRQALKLCEDIARSLYSECEQRLVAS